MLFSVFISINNGALFLKLLLGPARGGKECFS
jgi:hypothetical protein